MSHVSNKDDLFDSVVLVAQDAYQKGYEEGAEGKLLLNRP